MPTNQGSSEVGQTQQCCCREQVHEVGRGEVPQGVVRQRAFLQDSRGEDQIIGSSLQDAERHRGVENRNHAGQWVAGVFVCDVCNEAVAQGWWH
jgi:hypothetical protein